jgi:heme/copper-type cytochrome/quinol oxidase subunit 4
MTSLRAYTAIYVLLMALAISKFAFFEVEFLTYQQAIAATFVAAAIKTGLIAGYFQHLRQEPRVLTYVMGTGLLMVILLAGAATFSVWG